MPSPTTAYSFLVPISTHQWRTTRIGTSSFEAKRVSFGARTSTTALPMTNTSEQPDSDPPSKKKKKKKKPTLLINANLVGSISSDGTVEHASRSQGRLGVSSKTKKRKAVDTHNTVSKNNSQNRPLTKQEKQRTGNGMVDSTKQTRLSDASTKEQEAIQVLEAKRGSKVVTIVRGMTSPMEERKVLLKELKTKLGGGGSLVDGVLELQGGHAEKVLQALQAKGYLKAKKI
jgi:translation initiation factor 1